MRHLFIFLVMINLVGCGISERDSNYILTEFKSVKKFHSIFPDSNSKFGSFKGIGGGKSWVSRSIVYERYIIDLVIDLDLGKKPLVPLSEPVVIIKEVKRDLLIGENGKVRSIKVIRIGSVKEQDFLGMKSLSELFEMIDIVPIKDTPIENIDFMKTYWDS